MKKSVLLLSSLMLMGNTVNAQEVSLEQRIEDIKNMAGELEQAEVQLIAEYAFLQSLQTSLETANYIEDIIGLSNNKDGTAIVGLSTAAVGLLTVAKSTQVIDSALVSLLPSGEQLQKIKTKLKEDKRLLKKLKKDFASAHKQGGPTSLINNEIQLAKGRIAQNTLIKPGIIYKSARVVRVASRIALPVAAFGSMLVVSETGIAIAVGKDKMENFRDAVSKALVNTEKALEDAGIF
jgi:hypothetical protein